MNLEMYALAGSLALNIGLAFWIVSMLDRIELLKHLFLMAAREGTAKVQVPIPAEEPELDAYRDCPPLPPVQEPTLTVQPHLSAPVTVRVV